MGERSRYAASHPRPHLDILEIALDSDPRCQACQVICRVLNRSRCQTPVHNQQCETQMIHCVQ